MRRLREWFWLILALSIIPIDELRSRDGMELHKMKRVLCNGCNTESAYEQPVLINTRPDAPELGAHRYVTVKRCARCDTTACPNQRCKTRTMAVNVKNCVTCGTPLMPKETR